MKKIIKFFVFTLFLKLIVSCSSTNFKEPFLKGEMIFEEKNIIDNNAVFNSSIHKYIELSNKLINSLDTTKNSFLKSIELDVNKMMKQELLNKYSTKKKISHFYEISDSTILYYKNNSFFDLINRETNSVNTFRRKDSIKLNTEEKPYEYIYDESLNYIIKEYKDSIKVINGYKCFKVVFTFDVSSSKELKKFNKNLYELFSHIEEKYELYVTDKIKLKYHPTFKYKTILEKYYPLEIIKSSNLIDGVYTEYKLVSLKKK